MISRFLLALTEGEQPVIYGDGEQTRDFTYVANVVDGVLRAVRRAARVGRSDQRRDRRPHLAERAAGEPAAADRQHRRREVTSRRAPATCVIRRPTSPRPARCLVTNRWSPLDEGLQRTLAWFQRRPARASRRFRDRQARGRIPASAVILDPPDSPSDVLVLGGGPAGARRAHAAGALGRTGRRSCTRPPAADAAARRIPAAFHPQVCSTARRARTHRRAGFVRATGNTVWWGQDAPRVERFADGGADGRSHSIGSKRCCTRTPRRGRRIEQTPDRVTPDRRRPWAAFALDCSGRAGVMARAGGLRRHDVATSPVAALAGIWRADAFDVPDETHTPDRVLRRRVGVVGARPRLAAAASWR